MQFRVGIAQSVLVRRAVEGGERVGQSGFDAGLLTPAATQKILELVYCEGVAAVAEVAVELYGLAFRDQGA